MLHHRGLPFLHLRSPGVKPVRYWFPIVICSSGRWLDVQERNRYNDENKEVLFKIESEQN